MPTFIKLIDIRLDTIHRFSIEGYQGETYYWPDAVIDISPISYSCRNKFGGYAYVNFGSLVIARGFIDDSSFVFRIEISYGENDYDTITMFTGYAIISEITEGTIKFSIYEESLETNLLDDITSLDKDGNVIPNSVEWITFGVLHKYLPCQRIGSSTEYKYSKMGISGNIGDDYHVYDDGVNIDANVTDNGDGTFNLSEAPIGEVEISGSSQYKSAYPYIDYQTPVTDSVFHFIASKMSKTIKTTKHWRSPPIISCFIKDQTKVVDFLDKYCNAVAAISFLSGDYLYCFPLYRSIELESTDYYDFLSKFPDEEETTAFVDYNNMLELNVGRQPPLKFISGSWETREAVTDRTGSHVKKDRVTVKWDVGMPVGNEVQLGDFLNRNYFISSIANHQNISNAPTLSGKLLLNDYYKLKPGYMLIMPIPPFYENIWPMHENLWYCVITSVTIDFKSGILSFKGYLV